MNQANDVLWIWKLSETAGIEWPKPLETKERETGIEPATSSLGSWHSTAELLPLILFSAI